MMSNNKDYRGRFIVKLMKVQPQGPSRVQYMFYHV